MTSRRASVLVTGAARRIGAQTCRQLHAGDMDIALHYHRSDTHAKELQAELNASRSDSCRLYRADLQSPEELEQLCVDISTVEPGLAGLVNNASIYERKAAVDISVDDWDRVIGTNLRAPWELCRRLLPLLASNGGAIVNILDAHSHFHQKGYALYDLGKNALESLTRSLAVEFAPDVRVNGVAPGAILWPEDPDGVHHSGDTDAFLKAIPMQKLGEPGDIASAVAYLLCNAPYVTGQVLAVDGGRSISR